MKMTIRERDDGVTHVVLSGRLDTTGTEEIDEVFAEATAARGRPAIVDLADVDFLASRGIGLLIANAKQLLRAGHKMVLVNPKKLVASVLRAARTEVVMPVAPNLDEAIRLVGGVAGQAESPATTALAPAESMPETQRPVRAMCAGELAVSIKNELSELPELNARLAQFLETHDVPQRAAYAVNLAIDELVVNVMRYAYVDDDTHTIDIRLSIEGDQVILQITDDGRPFDPRKGPSLDVHAEEREAGGLGLILVLDMVDVLHYERVEDKNCVEVRIRAVTEGEQGELSTGEHQDVSTAD